MAEPPTNSSGPGDDLIEEMRYALRLAAEREQSATEELERIKRQFAAQCSKLSERASSAEKNADRAELNAIEAEERKTKSLQALRMLRCRLTSLHVAQESPETAKPKTVRAGTQSP